MTQDRLDKIEMLVAHQEQQIQDLSDMINLQRKEIDTLRLRLDKTQRKLVDIEATGPGEADGNTGSLSVTDQALRDKPPHY